MGADLSVLSGRSHQVLGQSRELLERFRAAVKEHRATLQRAMDDEPPPPPCFVSFGMMVLDDITYPSPILRALAPRERRLYPGGPGYWATLGARLFNQGAKSSEVGYILVIGRDFPSRLRRMMRSWGVKTVIVRNRKFESTKARLDYTHRDSSLKIFEYTSKAFGTHPSFLKHNALIGAKAFHFVGTPTDYFRDMTNLISLRENEPDEKMCKPERLSDHMRLLLCIGVFALHYDKLLGFFSDKPDATPFSRQRVEHYARTFVDSGIGLDGLGVVLVNCGSQGTLYMNRNEKGWVTPFYADRLVRGDYTGTRAAFLGGYAIGFLQTADLRYACLYGMVAASFAFEQVGGPRLRLPTQEERLSINKPRLEELWNETDVWDRLAEYVRRDTEDGADEVTASRAVAENREAAMARLEDFAGGDHRADAKAKLQAILKKANKAKDKAKSKAAVKGEALARARRGVRALKAIFNFGASPDPRSTLITFSPFQSPCPSHILNILGDETPDAVLLSEEQVHTIVTPPADDPRPGPASDEVPLPAENRPGQTPTLTPGPAIETQSLQMSGALVSTSQDTTVHTPQDKQAD
ncbi:hypothetical protein NUW58_g4240 [Xylaria curta]|uniref:Uncharacterized protein n=1 Tax=Xylaria curta TaxID=42375 RepID=A0ACC1P9U5_9PEZI|nr:hypothetical protein NUW58_g4240 [Xylaria curta]